ncbi:synaptotagmin C2 domain protein, Syn1 [Cichlidogyrus casuarinus]|uniref:Synaptotagmin C2 domain protein, Syn1 n=1 Tax=Cichlidogyrus casuarinus TaxID=1844966 RepID=A0ABD2PLS3_9PLAT
MADMFGYLKRRFSSGDLQGELADKREQEGLPGFITNIAANGQQAFAKVSHFTSQQSAGRPEQVAAGSSFQTPQHTSNYQRNMTMDQGKVTGGSKVYPSAPASPTRGQISGFPMAHHNAPQNQPLPHQHSAAEGGFMGGIGGSITRGIFSAASTVRDKAAQVSGHSRDRCLAILVIEDSSTDW